MRAYIEPDDGLPYAVASIGVLDDGEMIYNYSWITTPKAWRLEFDIPAEILETE